MAALSSSLLPAELTTGLNRIHRQRHKSEANSSNYWVCHLRPTPHFLLLESLYFGVDNTATARFVTTLTK